MFFLKRVPSPVVVPTLIPAIILYLDLQRTQHDSRYLKMKVKKPLFWIIWRSRYRTLRTSQICAWALEAQVYDLAVLPERHRFEVWALIWGLNLFLPRLGGVYSMGPYSEIAYSGYIIIRLPD